MSQQPVSIRRSGDVTQRREEARVDDQGVKGCKDELGEEEEERCEVETARRGEGSTSVQIVGEEMREEEAGWGVHLCSCCFVVVLLEGVCLFPGILDAWYFE
jgi:hypothetical protein